MSQFSVGQVVAVAGSQAWRGFEYKAIVSRLTPTQVIVVRAEDWENKDDKHKEIRFRVQGTGAPRAVGGWNYLYPWSDEFEYKHLSMVMSDRVRRCNLALAQACRREDYDAVAKFAALFLDYKEGLDNIPTFEQWLAERKK